MALGVEAASGICSARECTNAAIYRIDWRNPAIHRARTKTWLACEEHLSYLEGYFAYRSFPYGVSDFVAPSSPGGEESGGEESGAEAAQSH